MENSCDPLARELSEMSKSIPPLEFSYPQQSWSASLTTPVTTFNSEELFIMALSTPEHPAPPNDDPPPLLIPPPSTLQVPPFDYHHGRPCHYQHCPEPIYVVGSSSNDSDGSPRSSALSLQINDVHNEHHMNKKDAHFRKCELGLPLEDIHLCQIWNLWTRMGVMLWSLISSGTGTILSSQTLFLFSTALCTSSVTSFCYHT